MKELTDTVRVGVAVYKPSVTLIQQVIADYFGMPVENIKTHSRKMVIVRARNEMYYFCKKMLPRCPQTVIAELCSNGKKWNRSCISHGASKIAGELSLKRRDKSPAFPELHEEIDSIQQEINNRFEAGRQETVKRCPHCGQVII